MSEQPAGIPAVVYRRRGVERATAKLGMELDEAAAAIGVSYMTLWRAAHAGEFPAVKIRGRIVVPVRAVAMLFESALSSGQIVDAAEWTKAWSAAAGERTEVA